MGRRPAVAATHSLTGVDRTFLIEVFLVSAAWKFFRAMHHEEVPSKFSLNARLTKGVLCPKKLIHSIKNLTVL